MDDKLSLTDRLSQWLGATYKENAAPFLSGVTAGLAAHMFAMTNKLVNHDEIESLFGKGATVTSGRWGLELIKPLFPDWSMPWIYGLISILLISAAVCMILRILDIKSRPTQILVAALTLTFPSLTGTFCFMYTSSSYALAFLLSVLALRLFQRGGLRGAVPAALCAVLCLSIYQAYIAVTASLFVLLMIGDSLDGERSVGSILLYGVRALLTLAAALGVYAALTWLSFRITGAQFNDYVTANTNSAASIPGRILMAYVNFRDIFTFRNYYLISSEGSRYLHIAYVILLTLTMLALSLKNRKPLHTLLTLALTALLPLSVNCMYLAMSGLSIHTLVLYSFICLYLLGAMVMERLAGGWQRMAKDGLALIMALVALGNVYFANMTYLKMHLQYEAASAFYSALCARVGDAEGFDEGCSLAVIGVQDNLLYKAEELDTELLLGPSVDLINIYSRESFFREYLGFDIPFASAEELERIQGTAEFQAMAEYPYYGSVRRIGDCIVVKLG